MRSEEECAMRSPDSKVHIGKADLSLDYIILTGKKNKTWCVLHNKIFQFEKIHRLHKKSYKKKRKKKRNDRKGEKMCGVNCPIGRLNREVICTRADKRQAGDACLLCPPTALLSE